MYFTIYRHGSHLGHVTQISKVNLTFPPPIDAPHAIRLCLAKLFWKKDVCKEAWDGLRYFIVALPEPSI